MARRPDCLGFTSREVAMETKGLINTARELVQDENEREEILQQIKLLEPINELLEPIA